MSSAAGGVRAAVLAGVAGNIAISIYLSVTLPLFFGIAPILLFQWDASNIVGNVAYRGGWSSALLGLFFDFIVAIAWGAGFVLAYRALPALRRSPVAWGLAFGVVVMAVMRWVVVPLGHAQHGGDNLPDLANVLIAHTVFFGLPVALVAARTLGARR